MRIIIWEVWDEELMWKVLGRQMYVNNFKAWVWYSFRKEI